MIKFKDIKQDDLLVLKNSRDVIGIIIGTSDYSEKLVFYAPYSNLSEPPRQAHYGEL